MLSAELPVYKKTFELVREIYQIARKFNKLYKYSLGQSMCTNSDKLFMYIQIANRYKDKRKNWLEKFLLEFELIKTQIQLSFELHCINSTKYAQLIELCDNIGKQINGWKKA